MFLKISQISQENMCQNVENSNFIEKETLAKLLSAALQQTIR